MLLDGGFLGIEEVVVVVVRLDCSFLGVWRGGLQFFAFCYCCCCRVLMTMSPRFLTLIPTHIRIQTGVGPCESSEKNRFLGGVVLLD